MPYEVDIGDGADALGQNQLTDALDGTYWVSGWDATLGTEDLEVDIAAGEGAINGGDVSTDSTQTVDFTGDPDPDDPRKAVISVDDTGTVQKTLGMPAPADPADEFRFRTGDPQPPTNGPGVVVAEVWLGAGASSVSSGDIRDRRVGNSAVEDVSVVKTLIADGHTDVSGDRSVETVYQNTTGNPLEVKVVLTPGSDTLQVTGQFDVGSTNPPDKTVDRHLISLSNSDIQDFYLFTVDATVPDGHYYEIVTDVSGAGDASVQQWHEQELRIE